MVNILLKIAYDGSNYHGWQRQINGMSIQQKVEESCFKLFRAKTNVLASSRTDTGVHALGQIAVIRAVIKMPLEMLPIALNSNLPYDIRILDAQIVEDSFHPIFNAKRKTYEYKIENSRIANPKLINYAEFEYHKLDYDKMVEASAFFLGEHDFAGFCSAKTVARTTVRTIYNLELKKEQELHKEGTIITITVTGSGFLYNMVRVIAGTLIYVGLGKIKPDNISDIILSKDRKRAGKTSRAQGLTLLNIEF